MSLVIEQISAELTLLAEHLYTSFIYNATQLTKICFKTFLSYKVFKNFIWYVNKFHWRIFQNYALLLNVV